MDCLLQHGTVLLDNDADPMFDLIRAPPEKKKDAVKGDVKKRITSLRAEPGRTVPFEEAEAAGPCL
jgi:lipoate-protein ligase A